MSSRLIIDGNAVYEIDEECVQCQKEKNGRGSGSGRFWGWEQECTNKKEEKWKENHDNSH